MYIAFYFMVHGFYVFRNIIFILAMLIFVIGLYFSVLKEHSLRGLKGYSRFLFYFLSIWLLFSIYWGVIDHGIVGIGGSIFFDVFQYLFLLCGVLFIYGSRNQMKKFVLMYMIIIYPFVILGLTTLNPSLALEGRGIIYSYSAPSVSMVQTTGVVIYLLIIIFSYIRNRSMLLAGNIMLIIYMFCGFYFLKRYVFVDVVTYVIITGFAAVFYLKKRSYSNISLSRKPVFLTMIGVMGLVMAMNYYTNYFNILGEEVLKRFMTSAEDISSFDRFQEAKIFMTEATLQQLLLGLGAGSQFSIGIPPWTFTSAHLHLGYPNLIFKGGLILFTVIIIALIRNLFVIKHIKEPSGKFFVCCSTIIVLAHLTHSPLWGWWPNSLFLGMTLFSPDIARTFK